MNDQWNAFIDQEIKLVPTGKGALDGRTFAVKDVFSIKGYTSSAGNPDWLRTHEPAEETADSIRKLVDAGAALTGTLQTDELMYSLNGENAHYGTPVNPKAPDRIPGGSSSGSAAAAAAGLVDFAIGTDTGGSVRIPSSYCGLYGIRPTHGAVDISGVIPLAKSFDTVGWMAQDLNLLAQAGDVLLPASDKKNPFQRILIEEEAWALPDTETKAALRRLLPAAEKQTNHVEHVRVAEEGLAAWTEVFRTIQALEIWEEHGSWITKEQPVFGPGIAERFQMAGTLKKAECQGQLDKRKDIQQRMDELLKDDALLIIPTAPGPAPLLNLHGEAAEQYRAKTMQLTCIAGLAGLPQITLPLTEAGGLPVGLSVIAGRHQDRRLIQWASAFVQACSGEEVKG
ncbi:amidase [Domibacillus indicus]|uniref:amidase n=1 Tax=Domibacillus indicus TaxID=1437523 RepID=UPI00203E5F32|nr:amidase [Domibacillus indicus]MCM3789372.1 amidase [Domibacillus indicus]